MNHRVLIMGLPGSGKTTLAQTLALLLGATALHLNADEVRKRFDDWDFSEEGRMRQARRMKTLAEAHNGIVLADFVCPNEETRAAFDPHYVIWLDTIRKGRFEDTNKVFTAPAYYDARFSGHFSLENAEAELEPLVAQLLMTRPTGIMIGRFQPWHPGHRALFEEIMKLHGNVAIMVRAMSRGPQNPLRFEQLRSRIIADLDERGYAGRYSVNMIPNVAGVYYGRGVGYKVGYIELPEEIQAISATDIRAKEGL